MVIVGIDEVGRGCWAGPLVAGAVILTHTIPGLRDSKKISISRRKLLAAEIEVSAMALGLGWVEPAEIDKLGLTASVRLAMARALEQIRVEYDELIIDGNYNFFPDNIRARAIIKADDTVPAVSAASIVAKVSRDKYMCDIAAQYPEYGFDKHVGYGTALHSERLRMHGISPIHRKSYKPVRSLMIQ